MHLRSPLAKVRGLGSARDGTEEFIVQRLTAIALIPLLIWFIVMLISLVGEDYVTVVAWIRTPHVTVLFTLLILILFYHAHAGLREILEDYIHNDVIKAIFMISMKFFIIMVTVASVLAILRIALGDQ